MDEPINWSKQYVRINELGIRNYQPVHFDECKYIWKNLVPKSGQADSLQGEMLRQAEKLRYEACDNGNINWDDNFVWFCDFLKDSLTQSNIFDVERKQTIEQVLDYIKDNGNYARSFRQGLIAEEECDILRLAYTEDDLYDYLTDAIAEFYMAHREPIPYKKQEFIYR